MLKKIFRSGRVDFQNNDSVQSAGHLNFEIFRIDFPNLRIRKRCRKILIKGILGNFSKKTSRAFQKVKLVSWFMEQKKFEDSFHDF